MRCVNLLVTSLILFAGCDLGESFDRQGVQIDFALYNTSGWSSKTFVVRDTIVVRFAVTNKSGRALSYHYTGTPIVLKIAKGDSVVATSVDGLAFPQVVLGGVLENGQTLAVEWRAPNTPWSGRTILLQPGVYQAAVEFLGLFDNFRPQQPAPIQFTVYAGYV